MTGNGVLFFSLPCDGVCFDSALVHRSFYCSLPVLSDLRCPPLLSVSPLLHWCKLSGENRAGVGGEDGERKFRTAKLWSAAAGFVLRRPAPARCPLLPFLLYLLPSSSESSRVAGCVSSRRGEPT